MSLKLLAPGSFALTRNPHVVQLDVGLPDRAQRSLPGDDGRVVAGRALLDEVAADLAVLAARPEHDDVGDRAVADPALGAVEDVLVAIAHGRGLQQQRVRAVLGLGERESSDRIDLCQRREPLRLLLLRAEQLDRSHDQTGLHAGEGRQAAVAAGQLHRDESRRRRDSSRSTVRSRGRSARAHPAGGPASKGNSARSQ